MHSLSLMDLAAQVMGDLNPSDPFKTLREEAFADLEKYGFPNFKTPNWKYAKLKDLLQCVFARSEATRQSSSPSVVASSVSDAAIQTTPSASGCHPSVEGNLTAWMPACAGMTGHLFVFIDGRFEPSLSKHSLDCFAPLATTNSFLVMPAQAGIQPIKSPETPSNSPLTGGGQIQYSSIHKPGFTALNTVLMQDGAVISIPDNTHIKEPIQLLFIQKKPHHAFHIRNLIKLGSGAQAEIIETYIGHTDEIYFTNAVTEIILAPESKLNYYKIQEEGQQAFHIHSVYAHQAAQSQLHTWAIDKGSHFSRNGLQSQLKGEGANACFTGFYMASGKQYRDNHTRVEHLVPHTTSRELYKGIVDGSAQIVFNGQIYIAKDAQKSDAEQKNQNLILSDSAEIDSQPQLEIYADDVKCAHGATIADLSDDLLFYLRTRGISVDEAHDLLLAGFGNEIINTIPNESLRERLLS